MRLCRRVNEKLKSFNAAINHVTEFSKDGCAFPGDIRSSEPELRVQDIMHYPYHFASLFYLLLYVTKFFTSKSTKLCNEKCLIEQP